MNKERRRAIIIEGINTLEDELNVLQCEICDIEGDLEELYEELDKLKEQDND